MSISSIGAAGGAFPSDFIGEVKKPIAGGRKYEELSPERKAEVAENRQKSIAALRSAAEMAEAAKIQTVEVNDRHAPNVITLTKEQALKQIDYMSELIQSGEAEKTKLHTGYGEKTTHNYRQYVYWLQQHVKELEGAQSGVDVKA